MKVTSLLLAVLMTAAGAAPAETSTRMKTEIQHLLSYVARSECVFIRNGDSHSSAEAVSHMQLKYDYFSDEIDTAEAFIELSATRSTLTRRLYEIECPGQQREPSGEWLQKELVRFRSHASG